MGLTGLNKLIALARSPYLMVATSWLLAVEIGFGSTPVRKSEPLSFYYDLSAFRSSLNLPLAVKDKPVSIPKTMLENRLKQYASNPKIDPIQLTVDGRDFKILELAKTLSLPNNQLALANYLKSKFPEGEIIPGTQLRLVTIDENAFKLMEENAFQALFKKSHHEISISSQFLKKDPSSRRSLLDQLAPFLSKNDLIAIQRKILRGENLNVDKDLLPEFARRRVARHTMFKGPNCFHAALSFQSAQLASSSLVNVNAEPGYHREMINYDELWRILQLSFYEIDPAKTQLQYGDMIVLFETQGAGTQDINFKDLRHAATYLTGGYVFAKGSKSANSPYLVRTLGEEWETWSKYTDKLGAKVFRRSLKHVSNALPADPVDWVY